MEGSLLDMLLGRGDAISKLANQAANGFAPAPHVEQVPAIQKEELQNYSFEELADKLQQARKNQRMRLAAETIQLQKGQVLPAQQ